MIQLRAMKDGIADIIAYLEGSGNDVDEVILKTIEAFKEGFLMERKNVHEGASKKTQNHLEYLKAPPIESLALAASLS